MVPRSTKGRFADDEAEAEAEADVLPDPGRKTTRLVAKSTTACAPATTDLNSDGHAFISRKRKRHAGTLIHNDSSRRTETQSQHSSDGVVLELGTANGYATATVDKQKKPATRARRYNTTPVKPHNTTATATATTGQATSRPKRGDAAVDGADGLVAPADATDIRSLRSKDGTSRARSELVHFFPDYEEVLFGEPKEKEFIDADSTLFITKDDKSDTPATNSSIVAGGFLSGWRSPKSGTAPSALKPKTNDPSDTLVDLSQYEAEAKKFVVDPLARNVYETAHRRGERREKQMRNIEKDHARHERSKLERLLEQLLGPDWLKTMGVTGITDSEKKKYEPKRDWFIAEIRALLNKFVNWDRQEKMLKIRKDKAQEKLRAAAAIAESQEKDTAGDRSHAKRKRKRKHFEITMPASNESGLPHSNRTLVPITQRVSQHRKAADTKLRKRATTSDINPIEPPFTSFFAKDYERAAALGKHRRGRTVVALGHPVPEPANSDFEIPIEFLEQEGELSSKRLRSG